MCGICGIVNYGSDQRIDRDLIRRMTDTLIHRGPDDAGVHVDGQVGMGVRRLSIIDIEKGHQPIYNEDKTVCIVFNGEIYNYRELTHSLKESGHVFLTNSDTEVIVHLYEEHGVDCVRHLIGMFAFALWDSRRRSLMLARDRLGIKPLFYCLDSKRLIFGSEIKAILASGMVERRVDIEALHHYLSLNYMPWDRTMVRGVRKLLPGHTAIFKDGKFTETQYWDINYDYSATMSEGDYAEGIISLLKKSVKRRLISDVPLGFFLSGGIDSSTIVALASELSDQPLKTFSIGFEEESYSELGHARSIATRFGTDHHEFIVKSDVGELLPRLVWHSDEPSADSSIIPTYYLSKMTRQHVTVALSGDGGDEMFGGYLTYPACKIAGIYRAIPQLLRRGVIEQIVARLPTSNRKVSFEYKAKRFVAGAELPPLRAHYLWNGAFTEEEKMALYSPAMREAMARTDTLRIFEEPFNRSPDLDIMSRLLYVDTKIYLADDILTKVDRASMANSLEVRVPILDHELVEFAARIPPNLKIKGLVKKYIFKKATKDLLPYATRHRDKQGFSIPLADWLRGELHETVCEYLSPGSIKKTGYFDPSFVSNLIGDHREGRKNNAYYLWALLIFQMWHEMFIENNPPLSYTSL